LMKIFEVEKFISHYVEIHTSRKWERSACRHNSPQTTMSLFPKYGSQYSGI
jgi:hypothetical protein